MARSVDINCDMGEGIGLLTFGNDEELMKHISSANIACGWHGGDPTVMRTTIELALENDVAIGAHVGFPDVPGFGLHRMEISPETLYDWSVYQIGALQGFLEASGAKLQHVKPHGAVYHQCEGDVVFAEAVARAAKVFGDDVFLVLMGDIPPAAAARVGVPYVPEGFPELRYTSEMRQLSEFQTDDPEVVAQRAVDMVIDKRVVTADGTTLTLDVGSVALHGHIPSAGDIARRVRERLEEAA